MQGVSGSNPLGSIDKNKVLEKLFSSHKIFFFSGYCFFMTAKPVLLQIQEAEQASTEVGTNAQAADQGQPLPRL